MKTNMKLVIVALFNENILSDVLLALTSAFGSRVTILDAVAGTENLASVLPIFADFGGGHSRYCKLLFCPADSDNPIEELQAQLKLGRIPIQPEDWEVYVVPLDQIQLPE